jgi:subtilisin family serine protease
MRRKAGDDVEAQKAAVAEVLRELPRERFGSATVIFQLYQSQEQVTARLEQTKTQMLSLETASDALFLTEVLPAIVAHRDTFLAAIETVKAELDRQRAPREYRFQTVDLTRARDSQPVNVGVWDVGTNPSLFEGQLIDNDGEQANGEDDDGNGLVDDVHGVVADGDAPHTALLYEPDAAVLEQYTPFLRGIMDLRAGMASSEHAQRVLELVRGATSVDALIELERNLDAVGEWAHGTHVAGIMLAGVPKARVSVFRSAWAGEARVYFHRGPTDEELAAERQNAEAIATFVNGHELKVVNASLGFSLDYLEEQLRYEGDRYQTDAQVRARAEEIHAHRTETWRSVIAACPNTLFVVAAGNSNRDVVEYGDVPASLDLPNLLVVGAVDKYGKWAIFTNSNPERVRIFDHGVEVDSLIPDGQRVPLSGTSMASPNVANLATKMYSVHPGLTPAQAIEIIVGSGDPVEAPFDGRIANERRALTRARLLARR